jgi:nucleoprotein TPR
VRRVRPHGPYACAGISPDRGTSTLFFVAESPDCSDSPKAPILAQQRAEYEHLQSEAVQLASQLADALAERDSSASTATDISQRLGKTNRENELPQRQLNDLGRQVQGLLKEIARRQDPTIPSDEELEADEGTAPTDNIDEVITNHLVLFRSLPTLQAQNQKLLIVREMGAKMEAEERKYRVALEKEQGEAARETHEAITALQEQLEAQRRVHDVKMHAFIKERDSLKVLLARAERGSSGKDSHGQANGAATDSDLAKELAEIQEQFDAYWTAMTPSACGRTPSLHNARSPNSAPSSPNLMRN